jgi:hypothetical protein
MYARFKGKILRENIKRENKLINITMFFLRTDTREL